VVDLFNFEHKFSTDEKATVTVTKAARQSVQERQRDIFESHRHRAFSLAFYMTGSELEAEEILARTFIHAFRKSAEPDSFGVDSALIREFRQRFCLSEEQSFATTSEDSELRGENINRNDLETAIQLLPANERLVFLLRDVEGYSTDVIARLLDMRQVEIERAAFSARLRLRQALALRTPEAA
jgi:RNA polymerase sigma-70 factor (ECF subfamily)